MNAAQTTEELNDLGNRIKQAQAETRERAALESRLRRQRAHDRAVVARTAPQIEALEPQLEAMQAVVDRLHRDRAALVERIESTPNPSAQDARDVEDIGEALTQALRTGAQLIAGVSVHEHGGTTPMHARVPHPRLVEADANLDWTFGLQALQQHLDSLRAERDAATQRLKEMAA